MKEENRIIDSAPAEKDGAEVGADEQEEYKKQRIKPRKDFLAVVQADFPMQMDVFNWMKNDTSYQVYYILHDKDTYSKDEMKDGARVRTNGDGTTSEFRVGDVKPPHYHVVIHSLHKISCASLEKRFARYLHFEPCQDPFEASRYLTHETFSAREKYQYKRSEICGDTCLYWDRMRSLQESDTLEIAERWANLLHLSGCKEDAITACIDARDKDLLDDIRKHPYFYDRFFKDKKGK